EADDAIEVELGAGRCEERLRAAEAEADAHRLPRTGAVAERRQRRGGIGLDLLDARLADVRPEVELVAARREAGGAAEVVERDRMVARLGEALGELRVEGIEAADVGEDHDRRLGGARRLRERGREARP